MLLPSKLYIFYVLSQIKINKLLFSCHQFKFEKFQNMRYVWAYTIYKQTSTPTYKWHSTQNEQLYRKTRYVRAYIIYKQISTQTYKWQYMYGLTQYTNK
jgi:hypothetical protein